MIVPQQTLQVPETGIVSLAAYARHIQACECGFFGVVNAPACTYTGGCRSVWTKDQRDWVQYYLAEAQYEIEEVLRYFIGRRWVVDEPHAYSNPIQLDYGYVVSGGVQTTTTISAGELVDHTADPAVVGPVATTVTDVTQLHIFHPGSDIEIVPSGVTLAGGQVTFTVPRCRMVNPALADNPAAGLAYGTVANFSATVDVKRIYNVDSNPATLVFQQCQTPTSCTETESTACIYVRKPIIGSVSVSKCASGACGSLRQVKLSYYAGRPYADQNGHLYPWARQAQDAIIRLAHAKMPHEPCDCDAAMEMWKRDRLVLVDGIGRPTRGAISPFGPEEGAWAAYTFTRAPAMQLVRGATL